jgi:hypothetical protein
MTHRKNSAFLTQDHLINTVQRYNYCLFYYCNQTKREVFNCEAEGTYSQE